MSQNKRVLIVDASAECREVLRTALRRAGAETVEAVTPAEGLEAFQSYEPAVVVLDLAEDGEERDLPEALQVAAGANSTPIVILGTARLRTSLGGDVHYVQKPYHFAPLIRRIEGLLSARLRSHLEGYGGGVVHAEALPETTRGWNAAAS